MRYSQKLEVDAATAKRLEKLCRKPSKDVVKDTAIFDQEVLFPEQGRMVCIQVVSTTEPAKESCWTQGVLFKKHSDGVSWVEISCTEVGESFLGEYHLSDNDNEFAVEVVSK